MRTNTEEGKISALTMMALHFDKMIPTILMDDWLDRLKAYTVEQVEKATNIVIENYEYKAIPPFAVLKKALENVGEEERRRREYEKYQNEWGGTDAVTMLNAPAGASHQDKQLMRARAARAQILRERAEKGGPIGERRIEEIIREYCHGPNIHRPIVPPAGARSQHGAEEKIHAYAAA